MTPKDDLTIRITIVKKVLHEELLRLGIFPYQICYIGNHAVELTNTTPSTKEALDIQFCGLMWLEMFKDEPGVTTSVSYVSMQRFIAYMYGLKLFEKYKNKDNVQNSLDKNLVKAVTYKEAGFKNPKDESFGSAGQIANLLSNSSAQELEVYTEDFGLIYAPDDKLWEKFYCKIKVCHH